MKPVFLILMVIAFASLWLFAHFRNRQADRNDYKRERLSQKLEDLMKLLGKQQHDE